MKLRLDNRIVVAMSLYFVILFGCFLANNAALSIFLTRVGVKLFPTVFIINAFFMIAMTCVYNLFADRVNNFKITFIFFAVDIVALLALRAWLTVSSFYAPFVLYILVNTIVNYAAIQFWAMSDNVFTFMESKRFYSLVGAGGTLGTVIAGFSSKFLAGLLHTENLIILCAVTLFASYGLIWAFQRFEAAGTGTAVEKKINLGKVFRDVTDGFVYIIKSRMFVLLSLCIFIIYLLNFGIEYYYSDLVTKHFTQEDQITAFVGFWLGVLNLITLVIQFFFASKLISFLGVGATGVISPAALCVSYLFLAVTYTLPAGVFARIVPAALRFSLGNPVINIICYLADEKARVKVRAFMNIFVASLGMLVAGVLLNAVVKQADAAIARILCLSLLALSVVLIILSFMLKSSYRANIFRLLRSHDRTSLISYLSQLDGNDRDLEAVLVRSLERASDEDVVLIMDLLLKTGFTARRTVYDVYYGTFTPRAKCKFISCVGCVRDAELLRSVIDRFSFEPPEVQLEILKVADVCGVPVDCGVLRGVLRTDQPPLRIYAGKLLYKADDAQGKQFLADTIETPGVSLEKIGLAEIWHDMDVEAVGELTVQLLVTGQKEMQKTILDSLQVIRLQKVFDSIVFLLMSDVPVEKQIFNLMERTRDPRFVPALIDLLASPLRGRRTRAVRILRQYEGLSSAQLLERMSEAKDVNIQLAHVEVISSIKDGGPGDSPLLRAAAKGSLRDTYELYLARTAAAAMPQSDARDLLLSVLEEKIREGITFVFAANALITQNKTLTSIPLSLFASDKKHVDHAIESLFLLKEDEIINAVIPLTYAPYTSRVEKIAEKDFQIPRRSREEILKNLINHRDDWIRIAAVNLVRTLPEKSAFAEAVRRISPGRNEAEQELVASW